MTDEPNDPIATTPSPRQSDEPPRLHILEFDLRDAVHARHLRDTAVPIALRGAMETLFPQIHARSYVLYREGLLAHAGDPDDPVEVMLLEQLAMAHLGVARLHVQCGRAEGIEAMKVYGQLAVALAGELRRTALALKEYRGGRPEPAGAEREATSRVAIRVRAVENEGSAGELVVADQPMEVEDAEDDAAES